MERKRTPLAERFWAKVEKRGDDECWPWKASLDDKGYGRISTGVRGAAPLKAHRVAYELANGEIPEGLVIRHKCDNPACVNPRHLETGTQADNANDMVERGRHNPRSVLNLRHDRALNVEEAAMIRTLAAASMSQAEIGRLFEIDRSTVGLYVRGKR